MANNVFKSTMESSKNQFQGFQDLLYYKNTIQLAKDIKPELFKLPPDTIKKTVYNLEKARTTVNLEHLPDKGQRINKQLDIFNYLLRISNNKPLPVVAKTPILKESKEAKKGPKIISPRGTATPPKNKFIEAKLKIPERPILYTPEQVFANLNKHTSTKPSPTTTKVNENLKKYLKSTLHPHQVYGIEWMNWREQDPTCRGGILADDMGLGKTLTALCFGVLKQKKLLYPDDRPGNYDKVNIPSTLVICPLSLMDNWANEIEKHFKMQVSYCILHGKPTFDMIRNYFQPYDVVITTYHTLNIHKEFFGKYKWDRIILDESHSIKNPDAKITKSIYEIQANNRWLLTGTPIQNNLVDFYSCLRFLRIETFSHYDYFTKFMKHGKRIVEMANKISYYILLRRMKTDRDSNNKLIVNLPNRVELLHNITLNKHERRLYDGMIFIAENSVKTMTRVDCKAIVRFVFKNDKDFKEKFPELDLEYLLKLLHLNQAQVETQNNFYATLLVISLRLRQCCSHINMLFNEFNELVKVPKNNNVDDLISAFSKLKIDQSPKNLSKLWNNFDLSSIESSSKLNHLVEEIKKIQQKKPFKIIIVSQWMSYLLIVANIIEKNLKLKPLFLHGDMSHSKRTESLKVFSEVNNSYHILFLSLKAGGVGLNLTVADNIFIMDQHYNPFLEDQAADRIYRIGQYRDVKVHKYVVKDSIEEKIKNMQKAKKHLSYDVLKCNEDIKDTVLGVDELFDMIFNKKL